MYEQFFNLNVKPFELVPNPDFLFLSRSHKRALTHLDYGIKERIGFVLLTGEVGSGKTTIIRNQIKGLNGRVTVSKIFNTKVTSEQLISMINEDFGLNVTGKDKITLLRELNDFLIEQYADKCHPILIIDEAQNLTPELLEEVRMLSNLETDKCKLLQIILVGQPELRRTIAQPELRQLRQRISISCHISPLTRKEMEEYIFHRLKVAGNREAISFSDETFNIIYGFSRGIPRLVNIICDFLLLSAFAEGTRELSPELVKEVIGELEQEHKYWQDETLEKHSLGNEGYAGLPATNQDGASLKISRENLLRIIREIVNRIGKVEEDFAKSYISESEKGEIMERLSSSERSLRELSTGTKAEISTISGSVKDVLNELGKVRSRIDESEKRSPLKAKSKKRNLWKWMFS